MIICFGISIALLILLSVAFIAADTRGNDARTFGKFAVVISLAIVLATMIWMGVRIWLIN